MSKILYRNWQQDLLMIMRITTIDFGGVYPI